MRTLKTVFVMLLSSAAVYAQSVPGMTIQYAQTPPKLDGKLDDKVWAEATSIQLGLTAEGTPILNGAIIRMAWDRNNLYVAYDVPDDQIVADRLPRDGRIFERDDVMELFIWPRENQPFYYQIDVNPRGVTYDAFLITRATKDAPDLTLVDWSPKLDTSSWVRPVLYRTDKLGALTPDGRWSVEMSLPLSSIATRGNEPVQSGETWRVQFNRYNRADKVPGTLDATAWSPYYRVGWPHLLDTFGKVTFAGAPAPAPTAIQPIIPQSGMPDTAPTGAYKVPTLAPEKPATAPAPTPAPPAPVAPAPVTPEPVVAPAPVVPVEPVEAVVETRQRTFSLDYKNVRIQEALETLFKDTDLNYTIDAVTVDAAPLVTVKVDGESFEGALKAVTDAAGLTWSKVDKTYAVKKAE